MAKDKAIELQRKVVYLTRILVHKKKRLAKYTQNVRDKKYRTSSCICGEDPYCYCGSGTPGVIDY